MPPVNRTPVYNLKAVLRETGLTADVLRAWERRYGLPLPQRTLGGQRLYSQYDIALIKWLRARQSEGLSISRAVEAWKETVETGRDPLADSAPGLTANAQPPTDGDTQVEMLRRGWLESCLSFNEAAANLMLNQAFSLYPVEMVCTEIIQRGLSQIGDRWYLGEVSVQQEHYISALATRRLEALIASTPDPTREQTVMIGCPPGELHTFPALLLTLLLRRRGFNLVYLGADVPIARLTEAITVVHPDLVVLSAERLGTAASLRELALHLQTQSVQTAFGGLVFNRIPSLIRRIPAHFLGETIQAAMESIDLLSIHPQPAPKVSAIPETLAAAAGAFRQRRAWVDVEVSASMQKQGMSIQLVSLVNDFLGTALFAALDLGEPNALDADIEWIRAWMAQRSVATAQLSTYLSAYQDALRTAFGADQDWISRIA